MPKDKIRITKKRGDDGYRLVTIRMKETLLEQLDEIADRTNRSRNELVVLLLENALEIVEIEE